MILRLIVVIFLLSSCAGGLPENKELTNSYWFRHRGEEANVIAKENAWPSRMILPNVIDFKFNGDFIVAKQMPNLKQSIPMLTEEMKRRIERFRKDTTKSAILAYEDEAFYQLYTTNGGGRAGSSNLEIAVRMANQMSKTDRKMTEMLNRPTNFWIILAKSDSLIGPLSYASYRTLHEQLHIPKELFLEQ